MPYPGLLPPEPLPCSRPLQTQTSSGDAKTQFCLRLEFRLKLKTVGKTIRPFEYDLNQIPYEDTVEVTDSKDYI